MSEFDLVSISSRPTQGTYASLHHPVLLEASTEVFYCSLGWSCFPREHVQCPERETEFSAVT